LLKETYESKQFDKQENKMHESNEYYEFIFSEKSAYRAYDTFAKSAISDCDEGVCVKVNMPVNDWIYSFLLSLGNEVKVIEPKYIKKELLQLHKNIIRKMEEEQ
jgi:predicted DNA-binding transcriptional regulator YafY